MAGKGRERDAAWVKFGKRSSDFAAAGQIFKEGENG